MKTIINDTADVTFTRKSDGKVIFTAEAQVASINQTVEENSIFGGIGNKTIATIRSQKQLELSVQNAVFDNEWLAMSQGVAFENGTAVVYTKEETTIKDNAGEMEVEIEGTVAEGGKVQVFDEEGTELGATNNAGTITVTSGNEGDRVVVLYQTEVTGETLTIDASKFSEAYEVEFHTVEYSPKTNQIVKDLFIQFDNVTPSDNFELSFENGTAITPTLTFTAKAPIGGSTIGRIIEVDRVN